MSEMAVMLKSKVLAHVPHGFSTRIGGVSSGVFASLNFGNPGDLSPEHRDPAANIRENIRRAVLTCGAADRQLVEVHQVHGAAVHIVRRGWPSHSTPSDTRADALITDDPARAIGVRIADCAPVLIASRDGLIVAAIHAGWRGVIAGVLPATIHALREIAPRSAPGGSFLHAAVGPCIGPAAFEVGPEVVAEFHRVFTSDTPHVRSGSGDRSFIDLPGALAEQLRAAGVTETDLLRRCTFTESELFFSHRRATHDHVATGRMLALIAPAADAS